MQSRFTNVRASLIAVRCVVCILVAGTLGIRELSAQIATPQVWVDVNETSIAAHGVQQPAELYRTVALDANALKQLLSQAPMEFTAEARTKSIVLSLPMPDGSQSRFLIAESPMMEPGLAAQVPSTKTYSGQGIDDLTATTRFSWTPGGFRAIILHGHGSTFIAPYSPGDNVHYISYNDENFRASAAVTECGVTDADRRVSSPLSPLFTTGDQLRTYRLAIAATGEYTAQYGGGNATNALNNAIIPLINAINAVFEKEATIRMTLIANELSIIYTNGATDPYTNTSQSTMLTENQTNLTTVIGAANYDMGHAFGDITVGVGSFSGGGVAGLGVVCNNARKGEGATRMGGGTGSEVIFVSLVGHEFGHQFNAEHTFNGTTSGCGGGNRTGTSAYEPGGGSTLMGYTSCGDENLEPGFSTYFHTASLNSIVSYANGAGNCATLTATGNGAPTFPALTNFTIPQQTPFTLTATATDPNGNPLTYVWEEFDLGTAAPPNTDDGSRPIYRSFLPSSTGNTRTFPSMTYVLNNANVPPQTYINGTTTYTTGEALVTTNRTLNFHITARDNVAAGGGVQDAAMQVTVTTTAGPFAVTAPNTNITTGTQFTVTWNVANTTSAPVSCANVKISLSSDGGNTYPTVLAASTPNDGSEPVTFPNALVVNNARVKIEGVGNIFFDVSNVNFTIDPALPVQISSFTGSVINAEGHVRLVWMTISETNNYGFYVQRKRENVIEWTEIPGSFIPGHGTTIEPHQYSFTDVSGIPARWSYRLKQVDLDGSTHFTEPIAVSVLTTVEEQIPSQFSLAQNFPNPFNPTTTIRYELPEASSVSLKLYDLLGREVNTLINERQTVGVKTVHVDATKLSSGVYIYKLQANDFVSMKRMVVLK